MQREEQDRAYLEAEEQDRRRLEEEQRRAMEQQRLAEEAERRKGEKLKLIERIHQERLELEKQMSQLTIDSDNKNNTCVVRFKLPDGSQVQRKFHKTDKVQKLCEFVHCINASSESIGEGLLQTKWKPHECSQLHNYELVLSYPKTNLDRNKSLEESNCYPQAVIFVREENEYMEQPM